MKKISITLIAFLLFIGNNSAQWQTLHFPTDVNPLQEEFFGLSFVDMNNGLGACKSLTGTTYGNIMKTTNSGITWNITYSVPSASFQKIINIDNATSFAIGYAGNNGIIAKSTNSGLNWDTTMYSFKLNSIFFPSQNIGYIACQGGKVLKTIDSGNNWTTINTGFTNNFGSCYFVNNQIGFVASGSSILKTIDGGLNWGSQTFTGITFFRVVFPSNNIGYGLAFNTSIGDTYYIYKTLDNGTQWNLIATLPSFEFISDIVFPNDTIGYLIGQFQLRKSIDGGFNWSYQSTSPSFFSDDLLCLFFLNAENGFAGGYNQLFRLSSGGTGFPLNNLNNEILIFQNSTNDELVIEKINFKNTQYELLSITGQLLTNGNLVSIRTSINISNLKNGVYLVKIKNNSGLFVRKIMVQ